MRTAIVKWGNSQGIRIPKTLLDVVGLSDNDNVDIIAEDNMLIIKPARESLSLEKLFENWDGDAPELFDWGDLDAPVGRELI